MFNDQMKEALKKLLLTKYAGIKAAPVMPGLAEGTSMLGAAVDQFRQDNTDTPNYAPMKTDDLPPAAEQMPMPSTMPATLPKQAPVSQIPTQQAPTTPAPLSTPPVQQSPSMPSTYDDNARQQLYADIAKRRSQGAGWQALGGIADTLAKAGGSAPTQYAANIQKTGEHRGTDELAQFEAGKKGQIEDISNSLSLKKAGREEQEYQRQHTAGNDSAKTGYALIEEALGKGSLQKMGIDPNTTDFATLLQQEPFIAKVLAMKQAKLANDNKIELKHSQDDEGRLIKLGDALAVEKQRTGAVGQMAASLAGVGKLRALLNGYQNDLTPQEWEEAAIAWNRVLTQGGQGGGTHVIQALVPKTLWGDVKGTIQWLKNDPTGTGQQEFAKRLQTGMDREEKYAGGYIKDYRIGRLMDFQDVAGRKGAEMKYKLEAIGITPEDVSAKNPKLAKQIWGDTGSSSTPASGGWKVVR